MMKLIQHFFVFVRNLINIVSELFAIEITFFIFLRSLFLKATGINIQGKCFIDKGFRFLYPRNITIGNNVSLGHNNKIWAFNNVYIGDYVQSAIGLTIISGSHNNSDYSPLNDNQNVILEGENWIGANVTILGGVTVGRGTIIGAGSIVNKNLPAYSICAGNPCKVIREREPSRLVVSPFGKYKPEFFL